MKDLVEKAPHRPAYLQLYYQLREDIVNRVYPYHSKLPSKRTLAEDTGTSVITVEHTYALLCDEGYIESRERSGYFVVFRADDGFAPASAPRTAAPHAALKESGALPEFPFSTLAGTMRRVLSEYGEAALERSPNPGCPELREATRNYLARSRGIFADTEQIVIGSGSEYLYGRIVELLGRDRIYAIESPSYRKIEQVYLATDVTCRLLPLGQDGIESHALWESDADVLHITPYRSFPSGVTATASKRHEYIRWANRGARYLVEDDFESEFSVSRKPEETLFSLSTSENVIYINTFSKTISPSLRVGYMVLPKPLLPLLEQKIGFYACPVPTYMQLVLAELIDNGDFARHINRVRRKKRALM